MKPGVVIFLQEYDMEQKARREKMSENKQYFQQNKYIIQGWFVKEKYIIQGWFVKEIWKAGCAMRYVMWDLKSEGQNVKCQNPNEK